MALDHDTVCFRGCCVCISWQRYHNSSAHASNNQVIKDVTYQTLYGSHQELWLRPSVQELQGGLTFMCVCERERERREKGSNACLHWLYHLLMGGGGGSDWWTIVILSEDIRGEHTFPIGGGGLKCEGGLSGGCICHQPMGEGIVMMSMILYTAIPRVPKDHKHPVTGRLQTPIPLFAALVSFTDPYKRLVIGITLTGTPVPFAKSTVTCLGEGLT